MKFEKNNPKGPFESVSLSDWQSWQWQMKNSLRSEDGFARYLALTAEEIEGFQKSKGLFKVRTTPFSISLIDPFNSEDPLRKIQVPLGVESSVRFQDMLDPLGEVKNSVTPRLIHRYQDRVLFLVTDICSVYCRYCTRKRFTGQDQAFLSAEEYENSLRYIRDHSEIREVILSGGDPLTLSDERLDRVLSDLRHISHVEIIRIGSRMPTVNPFRLTEDLLKILKKYKPVYLMTHFNHPREITEEVAQALDRTADSGVPMFNQMVMLNGVNNSAAVIRELSRRLLYLRVKPYYMFQCDPSKGTDHLRTSIEDTLNIQKELWGHMSGLAMPVFSVDIPDGGGKTSFSPNYLVSVEPATSERGQVWHFKGFDGVESAYVDPHPKCIRKPDIITI